MPGSSLHHEGEGGDHGGGIIGCISARQQPASCRGGGGPGGGHYRMHQCQAAACIRVACTGGVLRVCMRACRTVLCTAPDIAALGAITQRGHTHRDAHNARSPNERVQQCKYTSRKHAPPVSVCASMGAAWSVDWVLVLEN